jgi:PAS domain S-box-containing protein
MDKWQIVALISVCLLQGVLITLLILQRSRGARAERRVQQAVDAAPTGMLIVAGSGEILLANTQVEALFGYRRSELLGQQVELLVPSRFRNELERLRRGFFEVPEAHSIRIGRKFFGRREDGSEFPIEIGLNPLQIEKGIALVASVIDMTGRREAEQELRHSHASLRELTGRLLGAQETERRRIARELHDDLGQSLALLSVELDLLQQRPPQDSTQLIARVAQLSSRVKQLSSSIHDLSHQLHPMKLEQLGLVAAIRGLCKELSEGHGLEIEFVHEELPDSITITPQVALCLYRVAQEAFQNITKHSRARHAAVEMRRSAEEICLTIRDDGVGFDATAAARQAGLGLASMRERMRIINGEITFQANSPLGTQINARVPLCAGGAALVELQDEVAVA